MKIIQLILFFGLFGSFLLYFSKFRSQLFDRIIVIFLFAVSVVFITFPNLTQPLAEFVGVGRGTDLVFYVFALATTFSIVLLYAKAVRLSEANIELIRILALMSAKEPEKN